MKKVKFRPLVNPDNPHLGEEVDGYLTEYKGIELVITKEKPYWSPDSKKMWWCVYERTTHMVMVLYAPTRKEALARAISKIEEKGVEYTKKVVQEQKEKFKGILRE